MMEGEEPGARSERETGERGRTAGLEGVRGGPCGGNWPAGVNGNFHLG